MGALTSRQNIGVEEMDIPSSSVYRYPPKSGNYFANHFIMGGEKFDSTHPEGYLFGENTDLNFLGSRPVAVIDVSFVPFLFLRCSEDLKLPGDEAANQSRACYNVEFTFDSDTQVAITIYYQAVEELHNGVPQYLPQDGSLQSETVHFKRGVSQQFCLPSHTVNLSEWADEELVFDMDKEVFPMVVQAVVDEGEGGTHGPHAHSMLSLQHMDGSYCVKPLKQKQVVDGVSYLLQEIYGIENKYNSQELKVSEDEISDNSAECVVCLSDVRDTLILPCRHLCLCNACADTLRYQANCCPICRLPFRALLQIRAMRKKLSPVTPTSFNAVITSQTSDSEDTSASEHIPPGYEAVSLLEALNGPLTSSSGAPGLQCGPSQAPTTLPPYNKEPPLGTARSGSPWTTAPPNGATPDSENVTLSSSGAIDQSSCTGTPLSSTITSPEGTIAPLETQVAAPSRRKEPAELARASVPDASWSPPSGGVPGMSYWEEASWKAQDTLVGLCLRAGLVSPRGPPRTAGGGVRGSGSLGISAETVAPATRPRIKRKKMDGWMGNDRAVKVGH
uniref:E3 ubiquitin-protein ligase n=1 Tax=Neogobius melanostomus TaxID=47308 RepID=A0A8C6WVY7_9GOBI